MMRLSIPFGATLLALLVAAGFHTAVHAEDTRRPNIVIIYADDLGYGDVTCYNPESKLPTPSIDRLAEQGMRFTDGHSSSGVCSPSRYTLLTGRYHWRTRLQSGIVNTWDQPLIAEDRLTLAGMLGHCGYQSACIGKWHLGWDWQLDGQEKRLLSGRNNEEANDQHRAAWREIFARPILGGPTARGFDYYFGTDVPNWPPYCFIENDHTVGIPSRFMPASAFQRNIASLQGPALAEWDLREILPEITRQAVSYIQQASQAEAPYFLYLPLTTPHTPLTPAEAFVGKSGLGPYGDLVLQTDHSIGQILEAIEQSNEADNTLVIMTSDNGCAHYIGVPGMEAKGHYPSGGLRGYKSDAWEGGHRVPLIVRWPGVVEPGSVSHQLVHQVDLMATLAQVAGYEFKDNEGEDSVSMLPLLRGQDKPTRETAISQSLHGLFAIRRGPWKLIAGPGSGGWTSGRDPQPAQLYHLGRDLGEKHNLYTEEPRIAEELYNLLREQVEAGRSTPGRKLSNDVAVRWDRVERK